MNDSKNITNPFTQRYLEIEALTNLDTTPAPQKPAESKGIFIALPFILIFVLFIGAFSWVFYKRVKEFNNVFTVLAVGFLLAAVGLSTWLNASRTDNRLQAEANLIPTKFVIGDINPTGFSLEWKTADPAKGAVRISKNRWFQKDVQIIYEAHPNQIHRVSVMNLSPDSPYYISILSGSEWYGQAGQPIRVQTPVETAP